MVRMRKEGVALPRRKLGEEFPAQGMLVILDVTDQGLRRQVKVARLLQGPQARYELVEPHIIWANDGRFTLAGFERHRNAQGDLVDYAQSWLCTLDPENEIGEPGLPGRPPRVER
jgi:hypothetical protein